MTKLRVYIITGLAFGLLMYSGLCFAENWNEELARKNHEEFEARQLKNSIRNIERNNKELLELQKPRMPYNCYKDWDCSALFTPCKSIEVCY